VTELRLNILKCEGMGFSKAETVKVLTEKYGCSRQNVYYHYKTRDKWQGDFLNFKDGNALQHTIISRLNYIYREASFKYLHADNSSAEGCFLGKMLEATEKLSAYLPAGMVSTPNVVITLENNLAAKTVLPQTDIPKIELEIIQ